MRCMMAFAKRMLGSLRGYRTQLALAVRLAVAATAATASLTASDNCVLRPLSDPSMRFAKAIMRRIPESEDLACARRRQHG